MSKATDLFRLVHAGHDVMEVGVVVGNAADPPLICLTCHEEQRGEPADEAPR